MNELREAVIEYRAKNNITQGELAEMCKVSTPTICNIEKGVAKPSLLTRAKIYKVIKGEKQDV